MEVANKKKHGGTEPILLDDSDSDVDTLKHIRSMHPLQLDKCELGPENVKLLSQGECLDDQLIDFFLLFLKKFILTPSQQSRWIIMNTHFFTRLTNGKCPDSSGNSADIRYERVKRWSRGLPLDPMDAEVIIIPVNTNNLHWWFAVIIHPGLAIISPSGTPETEHPYYDRMKSAQSIPSNIHGPSLVLIDPLGSSFRPYKGRPLTTIPQWLEFCFHERHRDLYEKGWRYSTTQLGKPSIPSIPPRTTATTTSTEERTSNDSTSNIMTEVKLSSEISNESLSKNETLPSSEPNNEAIDGVWRFITNPSTPRQRNSFDCGVFVLATVFQIAVNPTLISLVSSKAESENRKPHTPDSAWPSHIWVACLRYRLRETVSLMQYNPNWTENVQIRTSFMRKLIEKPTVIEQDKVQEEVYKFLRRRKETDDVALWVAGKSSLSMALGQGSNAGEGDDEPEITREENKESNNNHAAEGRAGGTQGENNGGFKKSVSNSFNSHVSNHYNQHYHHHQQQHFNHYSQQQQPHLNLPNSMLQQRTFISGYPSSPSLSYPPFLSNPYHSSSSINPVTHTPKKSLSYQTHPTPYQQSQQAKLNMAANQAVHAANSLSGSTAAANYLSNQMMYFGATASNARLNGTTAANDISLSILNARLNMMKDFSNSTFLRGNNNIPATVQLSSGASVSNTTPASTLTATQDKKISQPGPLSIALSNTPLIAGEGINSDKINSSKIELQSATTISQSDLETQKKENQIRSSNTIKSHLTNLMAVNLIKSNSISSNNGHISNINISNNNSNSNSNNNSFSESQANNNNKVDTSSNSISAQTKESSSNHPSSASSVSSALSSSRFVADDSTKPLIDSKLASILTSRTNHTAISSHTLPHNINNNVLINGGCMSSESRMVNTRISSKANSNMIISSGLGIRTSSNGGSSGINSSLLSETINDSSMLTNNVDDQPKDYHQQSSATITSYSSPINSPLLSPSLKSEPQHPRRVFIPPSSDSGNEEKSTSLTGTPSFSSASLNVEECRSNSSRFLAKRVKSHSGITRSLSFQTAAMISITSPQIVAPEEIGKLSELLGLVPETNALQSDLISSPTEERTSSETPESSLVDDSNTDNQIRLSSDISLKDSSDDITEEQVFESGSVKRPYNLIDSLSNEPEDLRKRKRG